MRGNCVLPPSLSEWYAFIKTITDNDILNIYKECNFLDWYQQYKNEFSQKYIIVDDSIEAQPLSEDEISSKFYGKNLESNTWIHWRCAIHPDVVCYSSLYSLIFCKESSCCYCAVDHYFESESIVPLNAHYDYYADNTYCDNQDLKTIILLHKPIIDDLYAHEIAMLLCASLKQLTTKSQNYSYTWKYQWQVNYPEGLLYSLILRGYIEECKDEELLDICKMDELRFLLQAKNIKLGSTKHDALSKAKTFYSGAEAAHTLGYKYYSLSNKGCAVLKKISNGVVSSNTMTALNKNWLLPGNTPEDILNKIEQITEKRAITSNIKLLVASDFLLDISRESYKGELFCCAYIPTLKVKLLHAHAFENEVNLKIKCGNLMLSFTKVKRIFLLSNIGKLVICFEQSLDELYCQCYELTTFNKCFDEKIPKCELTSSLSRNLLKKMFVDSNKGIISDTTIKYYISPADEIMELLLKSYFGKKYSVTELKVAGKNNTSANYCIAIPKENAEMQQFLMHLIIEKKMFAPRINGIEIFKLLPVLFRHSKYLTAQTIIDDESMTNIEVFTVAKGIITEFDNDLNRLCAHLKSLFPARVLLENPFSRYTCENQFARDDNYHLAYEYANKYRKMYDSIVMELKENGVIKSKWISEFSLYLLVKSYYPDTIYQYRADWLDLQSLDIFVPSLSLAIEYQGEQHSRPLEVFGGELHYQATVERDKRKKYLCLENNIKLIYWNYNEDITDHILNVKLQNIGVTINNMKSFPEIQVDTAEINPPKSINKTYIYQYDRSLKLINKYLTIADASKSVGIGKTSITKSLNGKRFLAGGCFWYKGEEPLNEIPESWISYLKNGPNLGTEAKKVKRINLIDETLVDEFDSIGQAARVTGIKIDLIRKALNEKKLYKGYRWEYI